MRRNELRRARSVALVAQLTAACALADGARAESPPVPGPLRIHDLQGRAHLSPFEGRAVESVPGVVTAVQAGGFYLQDPEPDNDRSTSEGVFVYAPAAPPPAVGEAVLVSGRVAEYRPGGRATSLTITEILATEMVRAPDLYAGRGVEPEVLGLAGRPIPTQSIDDDTNGNVEAPGETTFDPESDGIDFYESLEGMWLVVPGARVVGPTNRFGDAWLVADEGRGATGSNAAGGLTRSEGDENPERIKASDALFSGGMPPLDVGDLLGRVDGVLSYAFGSYELRLFERPAAAREGPLDEGATLVGDPAHVTIATLNVENLDPKVEDRALVASAGDVDDDVGTGRFERLAAQVVEALASPDVLALQEVQDGDGAEETALTDASATYGALVRAIEAAGGPRYAFADVPPLDDADGGQPGGNIRVGFLYRVDRVALRQATSGGGGPHDVVAVLRGPRGPELSHDPGRLPCATEDDAPLFEGTRKSIVAQFDPLGSGGAVRPERTFFVVNAHFASRAGSSPAYGPLQPPRVRGGDARGAQARAIGRFARALLAVDPRARLVVVGDLNTPGFLPPLDELREAGLVDVVARRLPVEERYTYVFEGSSQDLDHALVPSFLTAAAEVEIVHANAEYAASVTDHDPIVLRLRVGPESGCLRGLFAWLMVVLSWLDALFGR